MLALNEPKAVVTLIAERGFSWWSSLFDTQSTIQGFLFANNDELHDERFHPCLWAWSYSVALTMSLDQLAFSAANYQVYRAVIESNVRTFDSFRLPYFHAYIGQFEWQLFEKRTILGVIFALYKCNLIIMHPPWGPKGRGIAPIGATRGVHYYFRTGCVYLAAKFTSAN